CGFLSGTFTVTAETTVTTDIRLTLLAFPTFINQCTTFTPALSAALSKLASTSYASAINIPNPLLSGPSTLSLARLSEYSRNFSATTTDLLDLHSLLQYNFNASASVDSLVSQLLPTSIQTLTNSTLGKFDFNSSITQLAGVPPVIDNTTSTVIHTARLNAQNTALTADSSWFRFKDVSGLNIARASISTSDLAIMIAAFRVSVNSGIVDNLEGLEIPANGSIREKLEGVIEELKVELASVQGSVEGLQEVLDSLNANEAEVIKLATQYADYINGNATLMGLTGQKYVSYTANSLQDAVNSAISCDLLVSGFRQLNSALCVSLQGALDTLFFSLMLLSSSMGLAMLVIPWCGFIWSPWNKNVEQNSKIEISEGVDKGALAVELPNEETPTTAVMVSPPAGGYIMDVIIQDELENRFIEPDSFNENGFAYSQDLENSKKNNDKGFLIIKKNTKPVISASSNLVGTYCISWWVSLVLRGNLDMEWTTNSVSS
ncbi:hypothetical protein HK096_004808, partial [Nowakowskiella sp. JEL0078]